jgi:plasmid stabilization system protein ParE
MRAIFKYIEKENPVAAKAFVADLENKMRSHADTGLTGVPRTYVAKHLRALPYRDRCFYFRIIEDQLIVVRVLHGKQDVTADMFKD